MEVEPVASQATTESDQPQSKEVLEYRLHLKRLEILDSLVRLGIQWGCLSFIAACGAYSIAVLAGKFTFAQIGVNFLGSFTVSETISYGVGAAGVVYGLRERSTRRQNIQRMSAQIETLEKKAYPNRTSSHLTDRGTTQPEDR
jgi:hypothetical protein